jgi:hypothetical protein
MKPLTSETLAFVGDTWHVHLLIVDDGPMLARVERTYDTTHDTKQFVISTWDLALNTAGPKPPNVSFGDYSETEVLFVAGQGDGLTFFFGGVDKNNKAAGYTLKQGVFANGQLTERLVYNSGHWPIGGDVSVVPNDGRTAVVFDHWSVGEKETDNRWTMVVLDLLTGATIKSETFAIPPAQ